MPRRGRISHKKVPGLLTQFSNEFLPALIFVDLAYKAVDSLTAREFRARDRDSGHKKLIEEVLPIAAFIKCFDVPHRRILCRYCPEAEGHEAVITLGDSPLVRDGFFERDYFIEVTTAMPDYAHLEREALTLYGSVFGGGDIHNEGSKPRGTYKVVSNPKASDAGRETAHTAAWIDEAITKKLTKSYPQPCILLVHPWAERPMEIGEWVQTRDLVTIRPEQMDQFAFVFVANFSDGISLCLHKRRQSK